MYLLLARGLPAAPGVCLAWQSNRADLDDAIVELAGLGYTCCTVHSPDGRSLTLTWEAA